MRTSFILGLLLFFATSNSASSVAIEIKKLGNFSKSQRERIFRVTTNIEKIINTNNFKEQIINHKVNGEFKFENNENQTNFQIYEKIISGQELLDPRIDYKWQLNLNLKWLFNLSTRAYTQFNSPEIFINSRYYNNSLDAELAGTICHEYVHKVGYRHTKQYNEMRRYSVPYAVGDICELIYANNYGAEIYQEESCNFICWLKELINVSTK
jgi:hypothetical protein